MKTYLYNIIIGKQKDPLGFFLRLLFILLSFFYYLGVMFRHLLYQLNILKSHKLKVPVISVGNITWGGTGKTPLVEYIGGHFSKGKTRVSLLTRGYGDDEDRMLTENLPEVSVLVGSDRIKNALSQQAREDVGLFILDDGFGHLKIKRDLDIVAINATDPFGTGMLIPAGTLREPICSLCRAGMVIITKSNLVDEADLRKIKELVLKFNSDVDIFEARYHPASLWVGNEERSLDYLKGKKVHAVSALADNSSFCKTVNNIGADIVSSCLYADHYNYTETDIDKIIDSCRKKGVRYIITTQKDWVKLRDLVGEVPCDDIEFLVLKIRLSINGEEGFFSRVSDTVCS